MAENPEKCGFYGSAQPGGRRATMLFSCKEIAEGTCPLANSLPPQEIYSFTFPPTDFSLFRLLEQRVKEEKKKCPRNR